MPLAHFPRFLQSAGHTLRSFLERPAYFSTFRGVRSRARMGLRVTRALLLRGARNKEACAAGNVGQGPSPALRGAAAGSSPRRRGRGSFSGTAVVPHRWLGGSVSRREKKGGGDGDRSRWVPCRTWRGKGAALRAAPAWPGVGSGREDAAGGVPGDGGAGGSIWVDGAVGDAVLELAEALEGFLRVRDGDVPDLDSPVLRGDEE